MIKIKITKVLSQILEFRLLIWVSLGFFVSFLFLFINSVFFSKSVMQFPVYIPYMEPIGEDLRAVINFSSNFFFEYQSPYVKVHPYPPLTNVLAFPLIYVNFSALFVVFSLVTMACYLLNIFMFSGKIVDRKSPSIFIIIITTGLFSYGFQFELERGQFNVIAIFLCFLALWIFHFKKKFRIIAYLLFTISIQLKVWPLFFIVMFIQDWKDWRNNLRRFVLIGGVNFLFLFVLGFDTFLDYFSALTRHASGPTYVAKYNHSIKSFLLDTLRTPGKIANFVDKNYDLLFWILLIITTGCIFYSILVAFRNNMKILNPHLLLVCTLGALIITPTSHDYTLSTLAGPVGLIFLMDEFWLRFRIRHFQIPAIILLVLFSIAYSFTLFSYTYKPAILGNVLKNNFLPLFVMLIIITVVQFMHSKQDKKSKLS